MVVQTTFQGNPILNNKLYSLSYGSVAESFNYFNGWMDELRIWKVELTIEQIRQMMNQEIQNNGGNVKGNCSIKHSRIN
jgi:hypothetical protein